MICHHMDSFSSLKELEAVTHTFLLSNNLTKMSDSMRLRHLAGYLVGHPLTINASGSNSFKYCCTVCRKSNALDPTMTVSK